MRAHAKREGHVSTTKVEGRASCCTPLADECCTRLAKSCARRPRSPGNSGAPQGYPEKKSGRRALGGSGARAGKRGRRTEESLRRTPDGRAKNPRNLIGRLHLASGFWQRESPSALALALAHTHDLSPHEGPGPSAFTRQQVDVEAIILDLLILQPSCLRFARRPSATRPDWRRACGAAPCPWRSVLTEINGAQPRPSNPGAAELRRCGRSVIAPSHQ